MRDKETNASDRDDLDAATRGAGPGPSDDAPTAATLEAEAESGISLMALDAAILAARSRPASKPFGAAASEIKELAGQTARVVEAAAVHLSDLSEDRAADAAG